MRSAAAATLFLAGLAACASGGSRGARTDPRDELFDKAFNQPVPAGNVRLTVDSFRYDQRDSQAVSVLLEYRDDGVLLRGGGLHPGGLRVFGARADLGAAVAVSADSSSARQVMRQFLVTVPGHAARLAVVRSQARPYVVVLSGPVGTVAAGGIREEVTGSGMEIFVHAAGPGIVDLELRPYFQRARDGAAIVAQELATRVSVPPGRPFVVMASRSESESASSGLFHHREEARTTETALLITAEVGG